MYEIRKGVVPRKEAAKDGLIMTFNAAVPGECFDVPRSDLSRSCIYKNLKMHGKTFNLIAIDELGEPTTHKHGYSATRVHKYFQNRN